MSARLSITLLSLALPLTTAAPAFAQSCRPFWADIGGGFPSYPLSLAAYRDGTGSYLFAACECNLGRAFRWDGRQWTDTSEGLPTNLSRGVTVRVFDDGTGPLLYALVTLQPPLTCTARRWNGARWVEATGALAAADCYKGPTASIDLGSGPRLYGYSVDPLNTSRITIIRWNGNAWESLGPEFPAIANIALVGFNDGTGPHLYLVGQFTTIGGVDMKGFARWSGTAWEAAPGNQTAIGIVYDAATYNDGNGPAVFVYGDVFTGGSSGLPGVARWDGLTWAGLGGPAGGNVYARRRIEVFDDGSGSALYVTGQFADWGGVEAHGIAKWNGQAWSAVDWGIRAGGEVNDMVVGDGPSGPTMYIGGILDRAGAGTVHNIVQRVGCPNCYANCDTSTVNPRLNVRDFMCFINRFSANDPYADCNNDIAIDVSDFVCFLNKFAAGCP